MDAVPMVTDILDGLASVCICETDIIQRSILRFIRQWINCTMMSLEHYKTTSHCIVFALIFCFLPILNIRNHKGVLWFMISQPWFASVSEWVINFKAKKSL